MRAGCAGDEPAARSEAGGKWPMQLRGGCSRKVLVTRQSRDGDFNTELQQLGSTCGKAAARSRRWRLHAGTRRGDGKEVKRDIAAAA